eukprot:11707645-Prorocentrum_lima.AAC.1
MAFDTVDQVKLFEALRRLKVPAQIIQAVQALYAEPQFSVRVNGQESAWHRQHCGIRQGCPLSPY